MGQGLAWAVTGEDLCWHSGFPSGWSGRGESKVKLGHLSLKLKINKSSKRNLHNSQRGGRGRTKDQEELRKKRR